MKKSVGKEIPEVANVPTKPGKSPGLGAWPAMAEPPLPVEGQVSEFTDLSHHLSPEAQEQGFSMRHVPADESSGSVHFHGPKGQWLGRVAYTGKGTDQPDWQYHVGGQVMKQPQVHTPVVNHLARALGEVFRPAPGKFQGLLDEAQGEPKDLDRHLAGAADSLGKAEGKLPGTSGKSASWQGRPILDAEHAPELETSAALREFRDRVPRAKAEEEVHGEYTRHHHLEGAAHHLRGMKISQASGDHEEAVKHSSLYGLHLHALGENPYAEPPAEVRARMKAPADKKLYRYKGHDADSFLLGKSEEINAGYVLKKAWPKDEAENDINAATHQVLGDAMLEQGAAEVPPQDVVQAARNAASRVGEEHWSDRRRGARGDAARTANQVQDYRAARVAGAVVPEDGGPSEPNARRAATAPFTPKPASWVGGDDDNHEDDVQADQNFWTRIGRAAGINKKEMTKAWPKDEAENKSNRDAFPGGAEHQVLEDQVMEAGGKRLVHSPEEVRINVQLADNRTAGRHLGVRTPEEEESRVRRFEAIDANLARDGVLDGIGEDSMRWYSAPIPRREENAFWTRIGRAAGIQKSLAKAWPKDDAENQENSAGFVRESPPTQDRLMEQGLETVTAHTSSHNDHGERGPANPAAAISPGYFGARQDPDNRLGDWPNDATREARQFNSNRGGGSVGDPMPTGVPLDVRRSRHLTSQHDLAHPQDEDTYPWRPDLVGVQDRSQGTKNDRFWHQLGAISDILAKRKKLPKMGIPEPVRVKKQEDGTVVPANHPSWDTRKSERGDLWKKLAKAWPRDDAENKGNAATHPVIEDSMLERGATRKDVSAEVPERVMAANRATEWQSQDAERTGRGSASTRDRIQGAKEANYQQNLAEAPLAPWEGVSDHGAGARQQLEPADPLASGTSPNYGDKPDDQGHRLFWTRIFGANMKKAWPKDEKDNQDQKSGFPGGAAHAVMEDQHYELGGKREEVGQPGGPYLWEGMNNSSRAGPRGVWTGPGDIQGGGKRLTQAGPMGLKDSNEAEMNRHALTDMAAAHPNYSGHPDREIDPLRATPNPRPNGPSGLPFGGQDPYALTYDAARGDQQVRWNHDDYVHGHDVPTVATLLRGASKRAEKILADPPPPKAEGVPAPDTNAWAKLKAKFAAKVKKSDDGTGVVAAPKHAITNTFISPTKITAGGGRLTAPPPVSAAPKITPTQPQPGGLVPPRSTTPMVPPTPHPMDLGPGMAGHPRQISAPAIPPVTALKRSEPTIGQLLRKGWPKSAQENNANAGAQAVMEDAILEQGGTKQADADPRPGFDPVGRAAGIQKSLAKAWPRSEKENQSNRQAFLNEEPAQDALMEQGFSNKQQHGTSSEIGLPPAAPTEGRDAGSWPASQGGWKTGAADRIYEAQASHRPATDREARDAHDLAMRPGAGGWKRYPGTAVALPPPAPGRWSVWDTPRGATAEEDRLLVLRGGARTGYPRFTSGGAVRQIGIRNDVESDFWQLLWARAGLAAEKSRVYNGRAQVKVGKIPADIAENMAKTDKLLAKLELDDEDREALGFARQDPSTPSPTSAAGGLLGSPGNPSKSKFGAGFSVRQPSAPPKDPNAPRWPNGTPTGRPMTYNPQEHASYSASPGAKALAAARQRAATARRAAAEGREVKAPVWSKHKGAPAPKQGTTLKERYQKWASSPKGQAALIAKRKAAWAAKRTTKKSEPTTIGQLLSKAWPKPIAPKDKGGTNPMRDPNAAATHQVLQDAIEEQGGGKVVRPRSMRQRVVQEFRDEGHTAVYDDASMGGQLPLGRVPTRQEMISSGIPREWVNTAQDRANTTQDRADLFAEGRILGGEDLGNAVGQPDLGAGPAGDRPGGWRSGTAGHAPRAAGPTGLGLDYQYPRLVQAGGDAYSRGAEDGANELRLWANLRNELAKVRAKKPTK